MSTHDSQNKLVLSTKSFYTTGTWCTGVSCDTETDTVIPILVISLKLVLVMALELVLVVRLSDDSGD